jgi:hypothetical protein
LGVGNIPDQKNDRAECDEPPEKHENERQKRKTCVYVAEPTCNASQRSRTSKGPKRDAQTNLKSGDVSRHNPAILAVILLKPGHDSLRLSEVAPGRAVRPGRPSVLASPK